MASIIMHRALFIYQCGGNVVSVYKHQTEISTIATYSFRSLIMITAGRSDCGCK